jgi:hypothetical protein
MIITRSLYAVDVDAAQARRTHLPGSSDLQITIVLRYNIVRWCRRSRDINILSSSVEDRLWLFVSTRPYFTRLPFHPSLITKPQTSLMRVLKRNLLSRPYNFLIHLKPLFQALIKPRSTSQHQIISPTHPQAITNKPRSSKMSLTMNIQKHIIRMYRPCSFYFLSSSASQDAPCCNHLADLRQSTAS